MIKRLRPILLVLGLSVSLFGGCDAPESTPGPEAAQTSAPAAVDEASGDLLNFEWHLEAFGTVGEEDEIVPGSSVTLRFKGDGTLSGRGGCNNYSTTFQTGPSNEITVRALAATKMECADELMHQELAYFGAFADVSAFDVGAGKLQLFYGEEYEYAMIFRGEPLLDSEPAD
jgi:heat shock protein HslJ